MTDIVERYLACWNEQDADKRRALIADVFTDDVVYVDPLVEARGAGAVDATIAAVQAQFPGFVFAPFGPADSHHDQLRFRWSLGPAGAAEAPVVGFDVAVTGRDGRITTVLGFLDRVPG